MTVSPARAAIVTVLLAGLAMTAHADDGLDPYRELSRTAANRQLLALARHAMEARWESEPSVASDDGVLSAAIDSAALAAAPDWPGPPTGLYVTLVGHNGTRACVGSVAPMRGTLPAAVAALAVDALSADRRRPAIRRDELDSLRIVIAFAGPAEPIADPRLVDPSREGLIVGGADVAVAFLPGEARTIAWALREARRIGALRPNESASYRRFAAVVIQEPRPPSAETRGDERGR